MKFNIFEKKYQYIGLHVNEHALKAIQFDFKNGTSTVHAMTSAALPKGLIISDTFTDRKKLAELIKDNIAGPKTGSFSTNRVIVSIPESKSFIRVMTMPAMNESQAENAIMFEAEAYIPVPMDQVYFDWQILARKGKTMDVLLTASPKEYVDAFMQIIESAGLKLCGIEVEAQSVARALVPQTVLEPVLIADIDAINTALVMVEGGSAQFTSSVPLAGNSFTEKIVKSLSITASQAEKLKLEVGLENTVEYPNLKLELMQPVQDLAAEIKNILKYHYDHSEAHIGQLLITGGGAKLKHIGDILPGLLETYAPLNVTVANPLEHLPNLQHSALTPYEALSFTTAIGLAMWGMPQV